MNGENGMSELPSAETVGVKAKAMIAAGNTLENVAAFLGLSVDTLRLLMAHSTVTHPADVPSSVPPEPWHQFPETIVYRRLNYPLIAAVGLLQLAVAATGWIVFSSHGDTGRIFNFLWSLLAIVSVVIAVNSFRTARANRFELRPRAIALCTPAGCAVLPYAHIIGCSKEVTEAGCCIDFQTCQGTGLSIVATVAQAQDTRLAGWLRTIPGYDNTPMQSPLIDIVNLLPGIFLVGFILLVPFGLGIASVRDAHDAKVAVSWPVTDGVVTESVLLSGGHKGCRYDVRFHYAYGPGQQRYVGGRYQFGAVCTGDAMQIVAANPVGKHILVHYRPDRPTESVFVPGTVSAEMLSDMFLMLVAALLLPLYFRDVTKS